MIKSHTILGSLQSLSYNPHSRNLNQLISNCTAKEFLVSFSCSFFRNSLRETCVSTKNPTWTRWTLRNPYQQSTKKRRNPEPDLIAVAAAAETCFFRPRSRSRSLSPARGSVESKDANALKKRRLLRGSEQMSSRQSGRGINIGHGSEKEFNAQHKKTEKKNWSDIWKMVRRRRYQQGARRSNVSAVLHPLPGHKEKPWRAQDFRLLVCACRSYPVCCPLSRHHKGQVPFRSGKSQRRRSIELKADVSTSYLPCRWVCVCMCVDYLHIPFIEFPISSHTSTHFTLPAESPCGTVIAPRVRFICLPIRYSV